MAFPTVLYVRKHGRADPRTFEMAVSHVSLVGTAPVEIATYHLVSTTRWKRDVVLDERQERPEPPGRPPELRSARRKR
jgi:hypothetical protein